MPAQTGLVSLTSDLVRQKWMSEGLVQAASKSFWSPYTGMTKDNIVFQVNDDKAMDGHTVVFDFDGNLSGKAFKGKDTAYGKGEQKKKFSESLTVERYRLVVDNGDYFDSVNIGDLSISQHSDSRHKLADQFIRWKDQMLFDTAQGFSNDNTTSITHSVQTDASSSKISYQTLVDIETNIRTGTGFFDTSSFGSTVAAKKRPPLQPFRLKDGRSIWLLIIDPYTAHNIKSNTVNNAGIVPLLQHADLRGNNNFIFKGMLGQMNNLMIVEAESFFGSSPKGTGFEASEIEICGLRQYDLTNTSWSGQSGYVNAEYSRNLILGANALQIGFGKQPDYKFQESIDFGIKSESAVEFWTHAQRTFLTAENGDYKDAAYGGIDHGVIAWDVRL